MVVSRKYWLGLSAGVIATLLFLVVRHHRMVNLYHSVLGAGTSEATTAATKLASFRGGEATEFLLNVASPRNKFFDDRQILVVQLLAKRKDPEVGARLASSLTPQSALALRKAVANSLVETTCDLACTRSVMHYLERLFWGELTSDQLFDRDTEHTPELALENQAVTDQLYKVLLQKEPQTLAMLTDIYGLDTENPSPFALHLVAALRLRRACPALEKAKSRAFDGGLIDKLRILTRELECPEPRPIAGSRH